eukprot:gene7003-8134_t
MTTASTKPAPGPEFWELATSLLYAAARFNAFLVASKTNDVVKMQQEKDDAVAFFTEQYKLHATVGRPQGLMPTASLAGHRASAPRADSVLHGGVRYAPVPSLWLAAMLAGAVLGATLAFSWTGLALFLA